MLAPIAECPLYAEKPDVIYVPEDSAEAMLVLAVLPFTVVLRVVPLRAIEMLFMMFALSAWPSTLTVIELDELDTFTELAPEPVGSPEMLSAEPSLLLRVIVPLETAPPVISVPASALPASPLERAL